MNYQLLLNCNKVHREIILVNMYHLFTMNSERIYMVHDTLFLCQYVDNLFEQQECTVTDILLL
jgi:hypothetical protein